MKRLFKVTVMCDNKSRDILAADGENLLALLRNNGYSVSSFCGGNGSCKKCAVSLDGVSVLSCKTYVNRDMTVLLNEVGKVFVPEAAKDNVSLCGEAAFALDIGTTTLALALVDCSNSNTVETLTRDNPQKIYGADVISRIKYCTENGVLPLQKCLIEVINQMTEELCNKYSLKRVKRLTVAGNTVMMHLFFGVNCETIGFAPYSPVFLDSKIEKGGALGLEYVETVTSFPCIHSFFGGDLVSGISVIDRPPEGKYSLLIDLGTNAEIAIISREKLFCTSAAAGPCFEGANISCGMNAVDGAICAARIENGAFVTETIGQNKAAGVCGTGLIDVIAEMINNYIIDETGLFCDDVTDVEIAKGVFITQRDIREFQTAKSAVFSAVEALMNYAKIKYSDIDKLYLSGGFSAYINVNNAAVAGLIPFELINCAESLSNTSLAGAVGALKEKSFDFSVPPAEYIELSGDSVFRESFINNMLFSSPRNN